MLGGPHPEPVEDPPMSTLSAFAAALAGGRIEVVDLTAPLSSETPVIALPPQFAQTARFELEELSRYDDRGPAWYWNNIRTGEHTGTHFDAPNHWVTGADVDDVRAWEAEHGSLPENGWLLYRTGWDARSASQEEFLNADDTGPHTPGISPECARWLAEEAPLIGLGVETVGTDAVAAHSFDPP